MAPDRYMTNETYAATLTRLELAMIRTMEAFNRWTVFLSKAVGNISLSFLDIAVLHSIRMRGGAQNLSELLLFLNRNDVSTLQYSLRKLEQHGLVERVVGHSKREAGYQLSAKGQAATTAYANVRQELLVALIADVQQLQPSMETAAAALERMTGLYDQSTQTVLNRKILGAG
jgi:predicted MarR family transcription regulator